MADNTMIKVAAVGAAVYVAYTQGWLAFLGLGSASSAPSTGTPATSAGANPPVTGVPATTPANAPTTTLDSLYSTMTAKAKAAGDTGSLGVDAWGFYLNQAGISAPDPLPVFAAAIPTFDRAQTFTAPAYWAVMAPALKAQLGLSGLGVYGGLGALMRRYA